MKGGRKDGTKPTTHGAGPQTKTMPPRGPGNLKGKGGFPPDRTVGGKRGK
jgi:hypothetical protein